MANLLSQMGISTGPRVAVTPARASNGSFHARDSLLQHDCSIFSGWRDQPHDRFFCCSREVRTADCS
jgi:hypothetical protein